MLRVVGTVVAAYLGYTYGDDVVHFFHKILLHEGGGTKEDGRHRHIGPETGVDEEENSCVGSDESANETIGKDSSLSGLTTEDGGHVTEIGPLEIAMETERPSGLGEDRSGNESNREEDTRLTREHEVSYKSVAGRRKRLSIVDVGEKNKGKSVVEGKMCQTPF